MSFALDAYCRRIGLAVAPVCADVEGLAAVQRAHRFAIPFENLDIPLGRGISLDPDTVFDKLVTRRRGGYCFEQNQLFLAALHALGFVARPLLARVRLLTEGIPPRTHTLNLVTLDGRGWIADAGFGGSFTPPMPLEAGTVAQSPDGARHRLTMDETHGWLLERDGGEGWAGQYSFALDRVWPADLIAANHWTSTAPGTRFTTLRVASMALATGSAGLIDTRLTLRAGGAAQVINLANATEYRAVLAEHFGLALSEEEVAGLGLFEDAL